MLTQHKLQLFLSSALITFALGCAFLLLVGCTPKPEPFKTGAEVQPPYGCIEMRKREGADAC